MGEDYVCFPTHINFFHVGQKGFNFFDQNSFFHMFVIKLYLEGLNFWDLEF